MGDSMTVDEIVADCMAKGFEVAFEGTTISSMRTGEYFCSVRPVGSLADKTFIKGDTLCAAALNAAKMAQVPGY
jgi:hypothetical protein